MEEIISTTYETLKQMDEYKRIKQNKASTNWRREHPDKSAAIQLRHAAKLADEYRALGFVVISPLQFGEDFDIERALTIAGRKLRENAANGVYGGAAR